MKAGAETFVIFLFASLFLILLIAIVIFLPRLLRKKNLELKNTEINNVVGAFQILGSEIKSLKEQLVIKERLAALGEVSAGIAHEFRNPMGVIAGYAKLLLKSLDETDSRRDVVQGILKEIADMNNVMEELLKFSRPEPIKKAAIDLTKSIRDVIEGMRDAAHRIDFSFSGSADIKGDETLLKQAIKNIIQNALDAGDRVWVSIERVSSDDKKGVFVFVKDDGKGIPEKDLDKIFMPFYTTKNSGSGIGLALAQKIVAGHGGNINVQSKEGDGSTFNVFLPAD
jgi:signal transduction histidine kinase